MHPPVLYSSNSTKRIPFFSDVILNNARYFPYQQNRLTWAQIQRLMPLLQCIKMPFMQLNLPIFYKLHRVLQITLSAIYLLMHIFIWHVMFEECLRLQFGRISNFIRTKATVEGHKKMFRGNLCLRNCRWVRKEKKLKKTFSGNLLDAMGNIPGESESSRM